MQTILKNKFPLALALVAFAALVYFFIRLGTNDGRVLADFTAAYQNYDQAVTAYAAALQGSEPASASTVSSMEAKANDALTILDLDSGARISSLTRHDGDLMSAMLEVGTTASKEMDTLKAFQRAVSDKASDLDQAAQQVADITALRQAAYARFQAFLAQSQ